MRKYLTPPTPDPKDFKMAYDEAMEGGVEDLPLNLSETAGKLYENEDFQVELARLAELIERYRDLTVSALRVQLNDNRNLFLTRIREASGSGTENPKNQRILRKTQETA